MAFLDSTTPAFNDPNRGQVHPCEGVSQLEVIPTATYQCKRILRDTVKNDAKGSTPRGTLRVPIAVANSKDHVVVWLDVCRRIVVPPRIKVCGGIVDNHELGLVLHNTLHPISLVFELTGSVGDWFLLNLARRVSMAVGMAKCVGPKYLGTVFAMLLQRR
jgi:hypothetical protein